MKMPSKYQPIVIEELNYRGQGKDSISFSNVTLLGFDWEHYWKRSTLKASEVVLDEMALSISADRWIEKKEGKRPRHALHFPRFAVDKFVLKRAKLSVESNLIGTHTMQELNVKLLDLVLDSDRLKIQ